MTNRFYFQLKCRWDYILFKKPEMKHAMELATTDYFSSYSGLNSDISYGEIAGIGALTGAHVAACGLKSFDVISDTRCKN